MSISSLMLQVSTWLRQWPLMCLLDDGKIQFMVKVMWRGALADFLRWAS